jgi:regulator of nucleoside diphosphate kinase
MQSTVSVTDFDCRRLQSVVAGPHSRDPQDVPSIELLERCLEDAEVIPAERIGPDVVTMNSTVRISDIDTHETMVFRLVFPGGADPANSQISVLAPIGMAVLGRRVGDHVAWQTPAGSRRLRVDQVVYQPEREGRDLALEGHWYG